MNIQDLRLFANISYITIIFVFSLMYLALSLFKVGGKRYAVMALFGLSAFIRAGFEHQKALLFILPGVPQNIQTLLRLCGLFLATGFFLWYLHMLYPKRLPKWGVAVSFLAAVPALASHLLHTTWEWEAFAFWAVTEVVVYTLFFANLITVIRKDTRLAGFRLASLINLAAFGVYDALIELGFIHTIRLLPAGVTLLILYESLINIIDNYRMHQHLKRLNDKMQHIDRIKDDFLANTSHELRTPLHGIIGLAESMMREAMGALTDDQKSTLSLIVASGLRLSSLVSDILDYSKIKDRKISLRREVVGLYRVISTVLSMTRYMLLGKNITVTNNITKETPLVVGDPARIEQIFFNLVSNALKFTTTGEVSISGEEKDGFLAVTVKDTGKGISTRKLLDIFKAFDTGDMSLLEGYEGTGLGLSITKQLVELQGGSIDVESTESEGTTVCVSFPLYNPETLALPPGKDAPENDEDALSAEVLSDLQPLVEAGNANADYTVLVIDDSSINLQIMKNQLSSGGYRVVPALNGKDGLKKLAEAKPDLVILDVMMPEMDGYEVCKKIREKYNQTELPILLVTANSETVDMMEGLNAGANDFLLKPYTVEVFLTRIKTHLNLSNINKIYNQFVPIEFLEFLGKKEITDVRLGDQIQKDMTVLFVDIRAFTNLSENMTPSENFKFINSYLSRLSPFIAKHGGIIDKYIGDSIMALFPSSPESAVRSAIDMVKYMETYNHHRSKVGYKAIHIGVGVHTGNLILGIIGDEQRMQGTVISDAVNLASRIQNVTKLYGANVIISQETFVQMENPTDFSFRFLGKVKVKGKNQSVSLFEIFDADTDNRRDLKEETKSHFEEGILLFSKREFADAAQMFRQVLERNPDDHAARLFLEKSENFIALEKKRFLFNS
ncbi:MAG: response regulator [Spirochaetales bacterium]|nr:response regulator [Spirochaetales bacterium]